QAVVPAAAAAEKEVAFAANPLILPTHKVSMNGSSFRALLLALGRPLRPALFLLLAWLALFEVFRLVLVVATWSHRGDAAAALLLQSFGRGARFALSVAAELMLAFTLWLIWRPHAGPRERRSVAGVFGLVSFLAIFTLTAEIEFYKEFQMRLGPLALEYFSTQSAHNAIIVGMIWHGYPVVRWMLFCLALWLAFFWWAWRFLRSSGPSAGWLGRAAATVLWLAVSVVAIRGGLQQSVLRWGDAFFSQNTYANQMTQNGVFALIDTLRQRDKARPALAAWKRTLPLDQALATMRQATL